MLIGTRWGECVFKFEPPPRGAEAEAAAERAGKSMTGPARALGWGGEFGLGAGLRG